MELYIPPKKPDRNRVNGRFIKGSTPFNKGKKMAEWMDGRKIKRVLKGLQRIGRKDIGGQNKRKIIGIKYGKIVCFFESSREAMRDTGINDRNIRHCCAGKRKKAGGIYWFFESDFYRWNKIISQN